jgi:hypothetical protein
MESNVPRISSGGSGNHVNTLVVIESGRNRCSSSTTETDGGAVKQSVDSQSSGHADGQEEEPAHLHNSNNRTPSSNMDVIELDPLYQQSLLHLGSNGHQVEIANTTTDQLLNSPNTNSK